MDIQATIKKEKNVVIFTILDSQVNHTNSASLKEKLFLEIADGKSRIILNLKNVVEMDSSGVGALLFGKRQASNTGGNIVLVSVNEGIQSLLRIAQLSRVFDTCDNLEEARKILLK